MQRSLFVRIGLGLVFCASAAVVGGAAGGLLGARFFDSSDGFTAIANALGGMTIGCGLATAVAAYLSTRLDLRILRRATLIATIAGAIVISFILWQTRKDRAPAAPEQRARTVLALPWHDRPH